MTREVPKLAPLMPRGPNYSTIGEFYARLRDELESITAEMGEAALFVGTRGGQIDGAQAAPVLDAANAAYTLMLRCLSKVYEVPAAQTALRASLLDGSIAAMKVLSGLGCCLTELPATDGSATRAGVSFAVLKSVEAPWRDGSVAVLGERFREIAQRLPQLDLPGETGARLAKALAGTDIGSAPGAG